jgi:hypothetical protein
VTLRIATHGSLASWSYRRRVGATRLFKRSTTSDQEGEARLRDLLTEIDQLNAEQRAGAARGLAMLWEAFEGRFGGLDGFLGADAAQRGSYIAELRSAAAKMDQSEALARSRYALSPRLMTSYLDVLSRRLRTTTAREFARAVVTLIEQGSKIRALRNGGRDSKRPAGTAG